MKATVKYDNNTLIGVTLLEGDIILLQGAISGACIAYERDMMALPEDERNSGAIQDAYKAFTTIRDELTKAEQDPSHEITATIWQHMVVAGAMTSVRDQVTVSMSTVQYYMYCAALAGYVACVSAKLSQGAKVETERD